MPSEAPHRLSITEAEDAPTVLAEAADALNISRSDVVGLVEAANVRLARKLGSPRGQLEVMGDGLRVDDLAGLIRISPRLELEWPRSSLATNGSDGVRTSFSLRRCHGTERCWREIG